MDLRQLEAFVAVATLGSFRAAAARLNLTQPAISQRVGSLEAEIGQSLFDRSHHPVSLTEKAVEILPYAEQLLDIGQNIKPTKTANPFLTHRNIRIGTNTSMVAAWMPELTWHIHGQLPNLSIEYEIDASHRLREKMMNGALDLCLMAAPPEASGIKSIPLTVFDVVWAARPGLVGRGQRLTASKAADFLVVTFKPETDAHTAVEAAFRGCGRWPTPMITTSSSEMIVAMMKRAPALGTVVRRCIEDELEQGVLEIIDCEIALPPATASVCYPLTRSNDVIRRVTDIILDYVPGNQS